MEIAWYTNPYRIHGIHIEDLDLWKAAVKEIALLTEDEEALIWLEWLRLANEAMHNAGLFIGDPQPAPEEQDKLYARVDFLLGVDRSHDSPSRM